jgi:hypothetical protein
MTFGKHVTYFSREVEVTFTPICVVIFDVFYNKFYHYLCIFNHLSIYSNRDIATVTKQRSSRLRLVLALAR